MYVQLFQLSAVCDANYMSFNYTEIELQAGWQLNSNQQRGGPKMVEK